MHYTIAKDIAYIPFLNLNFCMKSKGTLFDRIYFYKALLLILFLINTYIIVKVNVKYISKCFFILFKKQYKL